jgi:hypothetical protein
MDWRISWLKHGGCCWRYCGWKPLVACIWYACWTLGMYAGLITGWP